MKGGPAYATVYEFEDECVPQTEEWLRQREIHHDNQRTRDIDDACSGILRHLEESLPVVIDP